MKKNGFAPRVIILVIAILGVSGYLVYKNFQQTLSPKLIGSQQAPNTTIISNQVNSVLKKETIVLQDNYSISVDIPAGYLLVPGSGDYVNYIVDKDSTKIIGFYRSTAGGELSPMGSFDIDGVPFTVDYRKDIGCPADIYPSKIKTGELSSSLYFGIYTWCADEKQTQNGVYEKVIGSIKFSSQLKDILNGLVKAPALKN